MKQSLLIILLLLSPYIIFAQGKKTFERVVASANDDGRENSIGGITLTSAYLQLAGRSSGTIQAVRFENIAIPANAVITEAYIEFYSYESCKAGDLDIYIELGDADAYGTSSKNISSRTYSQAKVSWTTPAWGSTKTLQKTPNLKNLFDEVFSYDWTPTQSVAFQFKGKTKNNGASVCSYETGANYRPKLVIHYETDGTEAPIPMLSTYSIESSKYDGRESTAGVVTLNSSTLYLGGKSDGNKQVVCFTNIQLPQTAEITEAYIEFYASGTSPAASMNIYSELGNANIYTTTSKSITARAYTKSYVTWITDKWSTNYEKHQTPDLKNIIDENRINGWQSSGNMAFLFEGLSYNEGALARSYDSGTQYRPKLILKYLDNGNGAYITPQKSGEYATVVATGNDDGRESGSGSITRNSSTLELGGRSDGNKQAIRFATVVIPANAEIKEAYIEFYSSGTSSKAAATNIFIEAGNAQGYTTTSKNISSRNYLDEKVTWIVPSWTVDKEKHVTPNLKALLDKNRANGWQSGQSMAFLFEGLSLNSGAVVSAYDRGTQYRPRLVITYEIN